MALCSVLQYRPPKGQPDLARAQLTSWVEQALRAGSKIVVTPEMSTTAYLWEDASSLLPHAELPEGPTYRALSPLARSYGAWLIVGFVERSPEGLYNSALILDHHGSLAGCYRKVLLYDPDYRWALSGSERPCYSTPWGRLVPGICMDLNDPGMTAHLERSNPDIFAFCTNWVDQGEEMIPYWRQRCGRWRGLVLAANTWGVEDETPFLGASAIFNSRGPVLAFAASTGDEILSTPLPRS